MNPATKPLRAIRACLGLTAFLMIVLFGAGWFFRVMLDRTEVAIASIPSIAEFEKRQAVRIGKPYDADQHHKLISIMEADAKVRDSMLKTSRSFTTVVFQIAGTSVMLTLFVGFLLARNVRNLRASASCPTEALPPGT